MPARREVVVGFDPVELRAPFILRCGALFLDYIVLIAIPVINLLVSQLTSTGGARGSGLPGITGWLFTALAALSNFVILPALTGQSIGKMLTGLRIVAVDGKAVSTTGIALRNVLGYILTVASFGLGFLIAGFGDRGRALHDYIAGTMVVYAKRRLL